MIDGIRPVKAQLLKDKFEHLEVIVLLIAHNIDKLIKLILVVALLCSAQILCHIDRSAVSPKEKFAVQSIRFQVAPYRAILLPLKDSPLQAFIYQRFSAKVSI